MTTPGESSALHRYDRKIGEAVFRFWRDVELFNMPTAPKTRQPSAGSTVEVRSIEPEADECLPWNHPRFKGDKDRMWIHSVFLGVADQAAMFKAVIEALGYQEGAEAFEVERITGKTWLVAFMLDEHGRPAKGSYVEPYFSLAVGRAQRNESLDGVSQEIVKLRNDFDEKYLLASPGASVPPFEIEDLHDVLDDAKKRLGAKVTTGVVFDVIVKSRKVRRPTTTKAPERERSESDIDFLNSFFANDLDELVARSGDEKRLGPALLKYLSMSDPSQRRDVLASPGAISELLSSAKIPAGRWPAPPSHSLSLAQQAAVHEILHQLSEGGGLIAVNGPPGTGKSTLLADVIADIVVQRARRLAGLASPRDVLGAEMKVGGLPFRPLDESVCGDDGIVVASSNNTAVENITRELPAREKIASKDFGDPAYFADVAQSVFAAADRGVPTWGLVAAALGNAENRKTFVAGFFRGGAEKKRKAANDEPRAQTLRSVLEGAAIGHRGGVEEWHKAKERFLTDLREVDAERKRLLQLETAIDRLGSVEGEIERHRRDAEEKSRAIEQTEFSHRSQRASDQAVLELSRRQHEATVQRQRETELAFEAAKERLTVEAEKEPPPFWARWLAGVGLRTKGYEAWRDRCAATRGRKAEIAEALGFAMRQARETGDALKQRQQECEAAASRRALEKEIQTKELSRVLTIIKRLEVERTALEGGLRQAREEGVTLPDREFWSLPAERRHVTSLWVTPKFNSLRSNLFLSALRLNEATILACPKAFTDNFEAVSSMLANDAPEPIAPKHRALVWRALFFCVPVVSTTLASMDRLFQGMEEGSLGWLLIDEAGQATPQSVAGALWRSRRAVLVGDPLQIEPVVTVPSTLIRRLAERYSGVDDRWFPSKESAQTIADRTMTFGAWVGTSPISRVWTGLPLRAHRRCASPMFEVANRIAYAGQMVQAAPSPAALACPLGESAWYDVRGADVTDDHVVTAEMDALERLLGELTNSWPVLEKNGAPSRVYVISPFKSVAAACTRLSQRMQIDPSRLECGTVHRFQGKEAEIVFLVLGSSPGAEGAATRKWASAKPNILNVALTRAKLRVYVVGDRSTWSTCPGFDELAGALEVREAPAPTQSTADLRWSAGDSLRT